MKKIPKGEAATAGYPCPHCAYQTTKVLDCRYRPDGFKRRRHLCPQCTKRFTTVQLLDVDHKRLLASDKRLRTVRGFVRQLT